MTTNKKLWLGFGTLTALLILVCGAIIARLSFVEGQVSEMVELTRPRVIAARELENRVLAYAVAVHEHFESRDRATRDRALELAAQIDEQQAIYDRLATDPRYRTLSSRLDELWVALQAQGQAVLDAAEDASVDVEHFDAGLVALKDFLDDELQPATILAYDVQQEATLRDLRPILGFALALLILGALLAAITGVAVGRGIVRSERSLEDSRRRLELAARSARFGTYDLDLATGENFWSREIKRLAGLPEDAPVPLDRVLDLIHADDRPRVQERLRASIDPAGTGEFEDEHRLVRPDGSSLWVLVKGRTEFEGSGTARRAVRATGLVLDITERKRAELALRERDDQLTLALQSSGACTWSWNVLEDRLDEWTPEYRTLFGFEADDPPTLETWVSRIHPADRGGIVTRLRRLLDTPGDDDWREEFRIVHPVRGERWIGGLGRAFRDDTGRAVRITGVNLDITERKRDEQALRDSEQRFKDMADTAPAMLWITDENNRCTFLSRGWYEFTGQTAAEALGFGWMEAVHPDDREKTRDVFVGAAGRREPFRIDYRMRTADGAYRWAIDAGHPRLGPSGELLGYIGSVIDVDERKRAEERMAVLAEELRVLTDSVPALISYVDAEQRYRYNNKAYERWFGHDREEIQGKHLREVLGESAYEYLRPHIEAALAGERRQFELEAPYKDGGTRFIRAEYVPDVKPDGSVPGYYAMITDLTDRKRAEEALREADRRKDEFLALLAHELRNPLAPLANAVELLRDGPRRPDVVEQVREVMERQVTQLVRLIDDLLDVSRISRGKLALRRSHVELAAVLRQAVEVCGATDGRRQRVELDLATERIVLDADAVRLTQVFNNLVSNACKFSDPDQPVHVRATVENGEILVSVTDRGIGIPADRLETTFEMFEQLDGSLERAQGGLGIGLTLVQRLVELHGGRVVARSEGPGKGSEFTVRLPASLIVTATPAPALATARRSDVPRRRVLVVDDNKDAADSLALLLQLDGNETRVAYDGAQAIREAGAFRPDLILLDIGLPEMNGYEVCRILRREPWARAIAIVALTGWGQEDARRQSREAGFDAHMVKPVDHAALTRFLAEMPVR